MEKNLICYRVSLHDPAGHRYNVDLTIPHATPEGQTLSLPAWIPGSYLIRDFARQIETLQASCAGQTVDVVKLDSHTWHCAPCDGPLQVSYTVYAWDLSVRGAHFDQTHAFFNGCSLFLAVHGQESSACLLDLVAPAHAHDWKVYTSLPSAQGHTRQAPHHGFGLYQAPDYDALLDHPIEIGTPQTVSFEAHGATHEMVFTGVIPNLDLARIAADTQRICAAQIALFEPETNRAPFLDSSERYVFLITVTGDGYGGLEHRASTALIASRADLPTVGGPAQYSEGYQTFLGLVSHEYFHTWNVKRIKPAAFAPYNLSRPNYTELLWVFEGFTSYYDDLMLLRSGVVSEEDYLRILAKVVSNVHRGGGRHKQSVAQSSFDAWTRFYKQDENSPNALVSYYTKGSLVALGLDIEIRQRSDQKFSLDDVMRLLWQRYGRDFYQGSASGLAEDALPALIQEATNVDLTDFITRYAYGYEDIPVETLLAAQGIELSWEAAAARPSIDARYRATADGLQLATVYEGGPAHQAGLSAGDTLVALNRLRITDTASLDRLLDAYKAGDTVEIHAFRRDELRAHSVRLGEPPALKCVLRRAA
ncbi:PDZ domain-containing protein [Alcaligenaceae bacterium CGII-47]|nr:PDZ domain-containing protein [Alcaligenaceae bacterium CGII-47]